MTHGASSRRHVLDDCSGDPNGFLLSLCKRAIVQVPSSVEVSNTTRELVVTLRGIFKLSDESLGPFLLVTYVWSDCVHFSLNANNPLNSPLLNIHRRMNSHLSPKVGQLVDEFLLAVMCCTFMDTSFHHPSLEISGFGKGGRDAGQS